MADLTIVASIIGKDLLSPASNSAAQSLQGLAGASSAAQTILPAVAVATAGLAAALGSTVAAAAGFEKTMSGVKAVMSPAEVSQFGGSLEKLALQLGKETAFSAREAAAGIEELIKGGLTAQDVLGGAAKSTLALAAAGGVSLPEAATIAANALAQFNLKGEDMAHVADVIAGAANASAIDVGQFKFSLAAAGAVAATVGFSFDDLAQGIAVMGKAGIVGSDAGTSLKTMMLNLQPSTKAQAAEFKRLGLFTVDSSAAMQKLTGMMQGNERATAEWGKSVKAGKTDANDLFDALGKAGVVAEGVSFEQWASQVGLAENAFFDATGKVKGMADVAGILQTATKDMTEQQRLASLEILFGSDAIRAGAVLSKAGAAGFNDMADAMEKVTAGAVGAARLDNLTGSMEQLGGSVETLQIELGQKLLPLFRPLVDAATMAVNAFLNLSDEWKTAIAIGGLVVTGLAVITTAGLALLAVLPAITAGFAAVSTIATVVAGIFTGPVLLAIGAVVLAVALLTKAWTNNWGDIQGKTAAAWGFLQAHVFTPIRDALAHFSKVLLPESLAAWQGVTAGIQRTWAGLMTFLQPAIAAFGAFWEKHHETIERIVTAAWGMMTLGIRVAWELFQGIIVTGLVLLRGDWEGAWDALNEYLANIWQAIEETVGGALGLVKEAIANAWTAVKTTTQTVFAAIHDAITERWNGFKTTIQTALTGIHDAITETWNAVKTTIATALTALHDTITESWNGFKQVVADRLTDIHTKVTEIWNLIPQDIRDDLILIASILKERFEAQVQNIRDWLTLIWTSVTTTWTAITTTIREWLTAIGTSIATTWAAITKATGDWLASLWAEITKSWTAIWTELTKIWDGITTTVGDALGKIGAALSKAWENIKAEVSKAWGGVAGSVGVSVGEASGHVDSFAGTVLSTLGKLASDVWDAAKRIGGNIIDAIKDGVTSAAEGLGNAAADAVRGALDAAKRAVGVSTPARAGGRGGSLAVPNISPAGWFNPVPGASVSQEYGRTPYSGIYPGGIHTGIDLAATLGRDVFAASAGTVTRAGWDTTGYGNMVTIAHANGLSTLYGHLNKIGVSPGQQVASGQDIGDLGSTGNSSGPHVHFELLRNGSRFNPRDLIPAFAQGVRDFTGGLALVGEQGPEVAYLPSGSDVYSNQDSRRMLSGGQPIHITLNVAGSVQSEQDLTRSIYNGLRELERSGLRLGGG
ncbi:MAG TPA: phage tail tape measure protein [Chloroflexota bacterium]|nr:phage tail tape measure protein [Chloroflexota bacterium]